MSARPSSEECDERTAIRKSFSHQDVLMSENEGGRRRPEIPKRYILALLSFFGFVNIYAMRVNLSIAVVAMTGNYTTNINGTTVTRQDFNWDSQTNGLILSSFFYGYIITQLPGGWLARCYGGKLIYGGGVLGTAVLTIITPPVARISPHLLVALRVAEGLCEGVTYPCIHTIWAKWAPPLERTRLATIAFSGAYVGTVLTMPLSGVVAETLGWSFIFYIFGLLGIVWFLCWIWFVTESPQCHPTISQEELIYIQTAIGFEEQPAQSARATPWKSIFFSLPVWAIIFAHFAENWGFYTMLTELPTYLDDLYHFNLYKAGFIAAIPYAVLAVMVQVGGQVADLIRRRQWLSTTNTRKAFNVLGFLGQTVFMIAVTYTRDVPGSIICLTLAVSIGGLSWAGFLVNHLDIAPQYAGILMGISNTFATIPGIVSPIITGRITSDGTAKQWHIVFFLAGGIYCAGAMFYLLFASGRIQPWAEEGTTTDTEGNDVPASSSHTKLDEAEDEN